MTSTTTTWELDPSHSSANFSVRHMMLAKVHGAFAKLNAQLALDRSKIENSSVSASIETASVDTRDAKRDEHLRSADFFDAAKFPAIEFKSKRFERAGGERVQVVGDLTIHGVTHEVVLDVEPAEGEHKDPWGNLRIGATATTKLRRRDFGLTWNAALEAGGVLVGDDVGVSLELEFVKKGT